MSLAGISPSLGLLLLIAAESPDAGVSARASGLRPPPSDPLLAPAPRAPVEITTWDEARSLLRKNSTDDLAALGAVERAQGQSRQALAALLPNLRASASVLYDLLNPDTPPLGAAGAGAGTGSRAPSVPLGVASVGLSQALVDVGAWKGLGAARAAQRGAEASRSDLHRRLTMGLAETLVAVVAAERVAELNRSGLALALERAALIERTLQLGAATKLDVLRVRRDLEIARGIVIAGDEALMRAREALGLALGHDSAVGLRVGFALDGVVREIRRDCRGVDWQARADVEAARANLESARQSREQASAGYLPALGLTSTLLGHTTDPGFGRFATWNVAAVLTIPLFEGGGRAGAVQERRGVETQARADLEATRRRLGIDVARARRGVQVAEALVTSAGTTRELAAQTDALTRRAFEVGRGTSLELVESAADLRQAEIVLAARQYELVRARLDAYLTESRCEL